jgi:hypothetical protein
MRNIRSTPRIAAKQRGFALMLVMFLTTLVLLSAMVAAPYIRTERQREKEEEMIWRGKQYVRGIKLFYRKNGRFPTSLEDLTKPKTGSLRFMRQAYKDPVNKADGSWRLIYVGPAGQLIGSLKPPQTFQLPSVAGAQSGSGPAAGLGQPAQAGGQASAQSGATQPGSTSPGAQSNNATATNDAANATPSGLVNADAPLIGGNIIGVGSKVNKRSIIVYDKAKNYRLFEFVWNPSKDLANALNQTGGQVGTPNPNRQGTGQSGFGQQNANPGNPPGTPMPTPAPNPPQP